MSEAGGPVSAVVRAASITTHETDRDHHLRSPDFFDVETCPELRFESTRVEPTRDGAFRVIGGLTIKGVTREVELEATVLGTARDPWGNERLALEARGEIRPQGLRAHLEPAARGRRRPRQQHGLAHAQRFCGQGRLNPGKPND